MYISIRTGKAPCLVHTPTAFSLPGLEQDKIITCYPLALSPMAHATTWASSINSLPWLPHGWKMIVDTTPPAPTPSLENNGINNRRAPRLLHHSTVTEDHIACCIHAELERFLLARSHICLWAHKQAPAECGKHLNPFYDVVTINLLRGDSEITYLGHIFILLFFSVLESSSHMFM